MGNVIRNSVTKFNVNRLTDAELDNIINHTHGQLAVLNKFLRALIDERVRRNERK